MWAKRFIILAASSGVYLSSAAGSDIPLRREFTVDKKISPCKNFHRFVCAKVEESFKLRDDRRSHSFAFDDSRERILERKKRFLHNLDKRAKLSRRSQELKDVYTACMNKDKAAVGERQNISRIFGQIQAVTTRERLQKLLAHNIAKSDTAFIHFGNIPNQDRPEWRDLYLVSGIMTLPERSYYKKTDIIADFTQLLTEFFTIHKLSRPKKRAHWVRDFESAFAETYPLPAEIRQLVNTRTRIKKTELQSKYPRLFTGDFLKVIPDKIHIRDLTPQNFAFLQRMLSSAPLDQLKSVYIWHATTEYMDDAYPRFYRAWFDFKKKHLGGPKVRPNRQERCTKMVMHDFGKELDAELLPIMFQDFPQQRFVKLAEKIRQAIITGIKKNSWLSADGRAAAVKKMQYARLQLVKPQTDKEWDFNPYVNYSDDRPHHNKRLYRQARIRKTLKELSEKRSKDTWSMGPLTVNAYYSPADNKFVMPIGILQYPFYDPGLPQQINLGAVGAVIGHELGHGIDDNGAKYDFAGKLKNWMSVSDLENFRKRGRRLVTQFDAAGHNGNLTLGENIGDLVGLTFAYKAAFPDNTGTKAAKQKFFIQYARLWCSVKRPKFEEMLKKVDSHAMGYARINEQVKHQPGFQEAFGCSQRDPMALPDSERVKIW